MKILNNILEKLNLHTEREQVEIYNREFQKRYNFGFFKQAEEIARKNNLGKIINDEQLMTMVGIGFDKTIHQMDIHLKNLKAGEYQGKEIAVYKKCIEELNTLRYWEKILHKKGLATIDYWVEALNKLKELN
jgi:hypothetical protein